MAVASRFFTGPWTGVYRVVIVACSVTVWIFVSGMTATVLDCSIRIRKEPRLKKGVDFEDQEALT